MTQTRLRAGLYARQSLGKQASVTDQHRRNDAVCEQEGWTPTSRYSDYISASRFGKKVRQDWALLTQDVNDGLLDVVCMWDLSRGDRTMDSWAKFVELCRESGTLIHATSHRRTYDPRVPRDWRVLMDDGVEAAFDSEQKSIVVRRGVEGAAIDGRSHGYAAFGYSRVYDQLDRKISKDVPDDNAPLVVEIFERIARRESLRSICLDLNGRGIPSPRGKEWNSKTLKAIGLNKKYIGVRSHHGKTYPGSWDAIIDEELFLCVAEVLNAPDRKTAAPGAKKYLLSYLATSPCGGYLACTKDKPQKPSRYYCENDGCTSIHMLEFDRVLTELVLLRLGQPDARDLFTPPDEGTAEVRLEVARLQARLDEAHASFAAADGISAAALAALERAVLPRIDALRGRLRAATSCRPAMELMGEGEFVLDVVRPRWESLPLSGQRAVISGLMERVELAPANVRLTRRTPPDERLRLAGERTSITWRS